MADADHVPTAFVSWAHTANGGQSEDEWIRQIFDLTNALRTNGVDADVDLFHLQDRGINWAHYGPAKIRQADFTIVAVNRAWKERFEGDNSPREGAGAASEANVLHGLFSTDQKDLARRLLIVLLPGVTSDDVPYELQGFQRVRVESFGGSGIEPALRLLHQRPVWTPASIGPAPALTAAVSEPPSAEELDRALRTAARDDEAAPPSAPTDPVPGVPPEGWADVNRALARNTHGNLLRALLTEVALRPGVTIEGKRKRSTGTVTYDQYLSLSAFGRTKFGYVWPKTGVVNPRASFASAAELEAVADRAVFLPTATNKNYPVRFDVNDERSLDQALTMLKRSSERP